MKKFFIILAALLITLTFNPVIVSADYLAPEASPQAVNQLSINKQVQNPQTGALVENLNITDIHFLSDQEITFQLEIKNNGNRDLNNILVTDTFPQDIDCLSGPTNCTDAKTLKFAVDHLSPGESKFFKLTGKVTGSNQLLSNQVTCVTNLAEARVGELLSQDTSLVCLESQVLGAVTALPKTGFKESTAIFLGSILLLGTSLVILKRTNN